jgi:hypothetical protein
MRLVPVHAAAYFAGGDPKLGAALPTAVLRVGTRVEVDADRLPAGGDALWSWWQSTNDLWSAARAGDVSGRAWARTRGRVVDVKQSTTKGSKADLVAECADLMGLPGVSDLIEECSGSDPSASTCRDLAAALGGSYKPSADGTSAACSFTLANTALLPDSLGGPLWPGEVLRHVEVDLKHAPWRDRRVRRLAAVRVDVEHLWAAKPGC